MKTIRSTSALALGAILTVSSLPSGAQVFNNSASASFTVNLLVQADCSINANPLNFGTTGVIDANLDAETTLAVSCTNTTPYNIGLNAGDVAGSTVDNRLLSGTAGGADQATVAYQLYQDAARATVWGDTQGTNTVSGVGSGAAQSVTVYGRVPVQDTPAPDTYQSTVTATVYF